MESIPFHEVPTCHNTRFVHINVSSIVNPGHANQRPDWSNASLGPGVSSFGLATLGLILATIRFALATTKDIYITPITDECTASENTKSTVTSN